MSSTAPSFVASAPRAKRLEVLFAELAQRAGQRNAIDAQIVEIAAEIERDELGGATGARSVAALIAWKTGCSPNNAQTITTIADRCEEFPRCVQGLRDGWLSLDQVGVIAERAGQGSDEHYAQLARYATVSQLRTAVKLEPRPNPTPGRTRRRRSPRPPTSNTPPTGSGCPTPRRPPSTPRCSPITTHRSPSGNATTPTVIGDPSRPPAAEHP